MAHDEGLRPPFLTSVWTLFVFTWFSIFGRLRDMLAWNVKKPRKGYAPVRDYNEDFYMRRFYRRVWDCYNRPIGSAPGAWIDVLEREDITNTSGMHTDELELTGNAKKCLNLSSYNYLGFASHDEYCTPRVMETLDQMGVSTCSSRLEAGTCAVHVELEQLVAKYLNVEDALTYGMGFATNTATIPALVGKGCLILSDALNHASIVSGSKLSGAKIKVFRHNDAKHLEALLREAIADGQPRTHRPWKKVLIIVEGIYSMEGEACNLKEIMEVKKKYKAYLYLDEAHSIGALGRTGRGCCEHCGVDPREVDVMMGTFTKSFGSCGGYVAGKKVLIDYLRNHSPAHLYACSMSPGCVEQAVSAFKVIMGDDGTTRGLAKVKKLHDNANFVRRRLLGMGLDVLGSWDSPVMPIMLYHPCKMPGFSRGCMDRHIAAVVVGFPATNVFLSRARLCISAAHTTEDLEWAMEQLDEVTGACMLKYGNKGLMQKAVGEFAEFAEKGARAITGKAGLVKR